MTHAHSQVSGVMSLLKAYKAPDSFLRAIAEITTEIHYVDRDWRSLYYRFFSRKHVEINRNCRRHLIWGSDGRLIGVVVENGFLRKSIFKILIDPQYRLTCVAYILQSTDYIHYAGDKLPITRFPWIAQDGEYSRCADVAIHNALTYLSDKHVIYKRPLLGDVVTAGRVHKEDRSFPSRGLVVEDMTRILSANGLYPKQYITLGLALNDSGNMIDLIDIYLESGFPVLCIINKQKEQYFTGEKPKRADKYMNHLVDRAAHAITIIGHGAKNKKIKRDTTVSSGILIRNHRLCYNNRDTYIVVNDAQCPYGVLKLGSKGFTCTPSDGITFNNFSSIIIPLPLNISILAEDILAWINNGSIYKLLNPSIDVLNARYRPFLMSASGYKQSLKQHYSSWMSCNADQETESVWGEFLKKAHFPHFIWIVEITTEALEGSQHSLGHVVFDATAANNNAIVIFSESEWSFGSQIFCTNKTICFKAETHPEMLTHNLKMIEPIKDNDENDLLEL